MGRISTTAELEFPFVGIGTFIGRDVPLKGADLGDVVQLTEPWSRPPGCEFFSYVRAADMVRVCCRNKTDEVIKVPLGSYGLIIEK